MTSLPLANTASLQRLTELAVKGVTVAYDDIDVVSDVNFDLKEGEIGCLLGPSGCGKSTLLRAIAGFETISAGSITLDGEILSTATYTVEPESRHMGMVFQDIALFPHLTIRENIEFGIQHLTKSEKKARIQHLLELVELTGFEDRYPDSLSG